MAVDFEIRIEHRPGAVADIGDAAGRAGVNLAGVAGHVCDGEGVVHVVVEDAEAARRAFSDAGIDVRAEREVLLVGCPDRPGGLGEVTRRFAEAGVSLDLCYLTADGRLVVGAEDLDAARAVL